MNAGRFLLLFCLALGPAAPVGAAPKAAQPDVFLVTIDTLRADHLHCYGYQKIQTPALDGLANDGIRFAQAFTPSPLTNTSHTSILTGLLPSTHGVTDFGAPLLPIHQTWAELLKKQGYQTAAFIGAIILDSKTLAPGLDNGFDFYDNFPQTSRTKSPWGRVERRAMDVVQRAESWITTHPRGPHFVWLHLYDPHDPYEPPAPFSQTYKDRLYDGEIAYADWALQHFIGYLKQRALYRNALIVAVGDHGEGLGEHGEDTHGIFLYDSTTHVPLILKLPAGSAAAGRVVEPQVRTIDILPTVLELVGISTQERLDGESLKPYFAGTGIPGRIAFGETDYPLEFGWARLRSARTEAFKFIEAPRPEFYDLRLDPAEMQDKYEPWNTEVQKFRELLAEMRTHEAQSSNSKGAVGPQTLAELRALGYLGRADAGSATNVPEPSLLPDPKDKIEEQNLLHKAMLASETGRQVAAHEIFEQVLHLDSDSYAALRELGELEFVGGQYPNAVAHLTRARALRPDDASAAFYEGKALEKTGDLPGAREALETSLKLAPGQFEARLTLGQVYLELKDINAAENQFAAAIILQPNNSAPKLWLARAYLTSGKFQDAVTELLELSKADGRDAALFQLLGQAYRGLGKETDARQAEARGRLLRRSKQKL
jgi:arylsulfatase A-like enzyme/Flp pilus assembly protein TadD